MQTTQKIRIEIPVLATMVYDLDANELKDMLADLESNDEPLTLDAVGDYLRLTLDKVSKVEFVDYDQAAESGVFLHNDSELMDEEFFDLQQLSEVLEFMAE